MWRKAFIFMNYSRGVMKYEQTWHTLIACLLWRSDDLMRLNVTGGNVSFNKKLL